MLYGPKMPDFTLTCDRCYQDIRVAEYFTIFGHTRLTVGAYRLVDPETFKPTIWAEYGRGVEETLCRSCMWNDAGFLAKFPHMSNPKIQELIIGKGMK